MLHQYTPTKGVTKLGHEVVCPETPRKAAQRTGPCYFEVKGQLSSPVHWCSPAITDSRPEPPPLNLITISTGFSGYIRGQPLIPERFIGLACAKSLLYGTHLFLDAYDAAYLELDSCRSGSQM